VSSYAGITEVSQENNQGSDINEISTSSLVIESDSALKSSISDSTSENESSESEIVEVPEETQLEIETLTEEDELKRYKVILKLEDLPKLKQECDQFLSKGKEEFENQGINGEPLDEFYKELKKFVMKAKEEAKAAIFFKPGNSNQYNTFFRTNSVYRFQREASKAFHRLNYADKWIQNRINSVDNQEVKHQLNRIQEELKNALISIGQNTETLINETKRVSRIGFGKIRSNNEDPKTKLLIKAIFNNQFLDTIRGSISKIDQLITKNKNGLLSWMK